MAKARAGSQAIVTQLKYLAVLTCMITTTLDIGVRVTTSDEVVTFLVYIHNH